MKLTPSFPCSEPSMMPQNPQQQAQAPQELRHELASLASCTLAPLPSLALFVFGPLPTVLPARSSLFPHCRWPLAFLSETFLESVCLFGLVGSTATSHLPTILVSFLVSSPVSSPALTAAGGPFQMLTRPCCFSLQAFHGFLPLPGCHPHSLTQPSGHHQPCHSPALPPPRCPSLT